MPSPQLLAKFEADAAELTKAAANQAEQAEQAEARVAELQYAQSQEGITLADLLARVEALRGELSVRQQAIDDGRIRGASYREAAAALQSDADYLTAQASQASTDRPLPKGVAALAGPRPVATATPSETTCPACHGDMIPDALGWIHAATRLAGCAAPSAASTSPASEHRVIP